jgi:hypothetical protein
MSDWVLLAYRLPREPSTPRIALWRQLRRLGVAQLADGVIALPSDARTRERLEWLADDVVERGGEATIWLGKPGTAGQERTLARRMAAVIDKEYEAVIREAQGSGGEPSARRLGKLRRELRRIGSRDYFPGSARDRAHRTVEALARQLEAVS